MVLAITYGDILTLLPFGNRADSYDLLGKYIWDMMERSVSEINKVHTKLDHMLHVSGRLLLLFNFVSAVLLHKNLS